MKEWRSSNPIKAAIKGRNDRYRRFGILNADGSQFTTVDYDRQYQLQQGRCAGCGIHQSEASGSFHADHDHVTGMFRALLCRPCNQALGLVQDNSAVLRKLADLLDA